MTEPTSAVVGLPVPDESAELHVRGAAAFVDDVAEPRGTLHVALVLSPVAHGVVTSVDVSAAPRMPGSSPSSAPPTSPARTTAARSCTTSRSWPTAS